MDDLSVTDRNTLRRIFEKKADDIPERAVSNAFIHDCGHDDGTPCRNKEAL